MAKFGLVVGVLLAAVEAGVSIGYIEARGSVRHELLQAQVNPRAQVLQEFQDRIEKYMELHNKAKQQAPPLKESENPAEIKQAEDALAASIRASRAGAKQGDVFSPEISRLFRSLIYPETKGTEGAETKEAIRDAQPDGAAFKLKVNARYPKDEPLPTVPPNLLANLPKLPEALEYRIVRNHLILRDVPANVIVDFIPNAIR